MKQDGIVIMLHQINPQIPNLAQINEQVCLHAIAKSNFYLSSAMYIFNLVYLLATKGVKHRDSWV